MSPSPEDQPSQLGAQLCVSWSWGRSFWPSFWPPSPGSHLQMELPGLGQDFQLSPFSYYWKTLCKLSPKLFPFVIAFGSEKMLPLRGEARGEGTLPPKRCLLRSAAGEIQIALKRCYFVL